MSEKLYCVYMRTNKINGKKYVGITCRDVNIRWNNGKGYIHNDYFYRAICKYGWDGFMHEILARGLSKEDACEMEIALIAQFHTQEADFGYNITAGGDHACHTEASKDKMSRNSGNKRPVNFGGMTFDSVQHCAKFLGIKYNDLIKHLSTDCQIIYRNDIVPISYIDNKTKRICRYRCVKCDGAQFESVRCCANHYKVNENTMRDWLKGRYITPIDFVNKNLHYIDEDPNYQKVDNPYKRSIFYNGSYYDNITDFCESQHIDYRIVLKWNYDNIPQKYLENGFKFIKPFIAKPIKIEKEKII